VHAKDLLGLSIARYDTTLVRSLAHEVLAVPEAAGLNVVLASFGNTPPRWRRDRRVRRAGRSGHARGRRRGARRRHRGRVRPESRGARRDRAGCVVGGSSSRPTRSSGSPGSSCPTASTTPSPAWCSTGSNASRKWATRSSVDGILIEVLDVDGFAIVELRLDPSPTPRRRDASGDDADGDDRPRPAMPVTKGIQVNWDGLAVAVVLLASTGSSLQPSSRCWPHAAHASSSWPLTATAGRSTRWPAFAS
jgi:hypothetical protein